jgi:hypothetical protein
MKRITLLPKAASFFAVVLLAAITLFSKVSAQVIVPPMLPDNFVGHSGYPNSSTIDYSNFFFAPVPQFTAMVTDGGPGGNPVILYTNDLSGPPGWTATIVPAPAGSSADVVVGNDMNVPGDLLIGVLVDMPNCLFGNDAILFVYSQAGPAPYAGAPVLIGTFNLSGSCRVSGPPHIDIFDEYSTLIGFPPTLLPRATIFAATWKDNAQGIMGYCAKLNAPLGGTPTVMNPNTNLSSPDVAGVERLNSAGNFELWELFSYLDQSGSPNKLIYQEWNVSAALVGPATTYDAQNYVVMTPFISGTRIDAIDDYHYNNPAGGLAYFDIVTSVAPVAGGAAIYQYNNLNGPFPPLAWTDITSPVPGVKGNKNVVPQVSAGQGKYYSIVYHSYGIYGQRYLANAIDWGTGRTTTTANAYQVNLNPYGPSGGWPYGICVSGTHNTNMCGQQQLFTGFENNGAQWEKYNASPCPPFAFKQDPGIVAAPNTNTDWLLAPNPASDHVTLTAPAGYKADDGAAYSITDLSGKTLLHGAVNDAQQQIGVSNLPAGMYMLHVQDQKTNMKTIKFVKD